MYSRPCDICDGCKSASDRWVGLKARNLAYPDLSPDIVAGGKIIYSHRPREDVVGEKVMRNCRPKLEAETDIAQVPGQPTFGKP